LVAGRFAHINPSVRHPTPDGATFRWVGWEYLYEKNITERVHEIEGVYYDEGQKTELTEKAR
ncbi:MAG: ABC transporter substrate-binding protein, partial [Treponema sp.]|nr:ABC transporter substrate-binding protein [Treponema sp.]